MAHEEIDAASLRAGDVYRLMTDLVAPRPIAWVGTVDGQGRRNLAPYSYFQAVCSAPATVVLGMGWMRDGRPKNSLANILETRGFTISHVRRGDAEAMNDTSVELPHGESEWDRVQVPSAPSAVVAPPWVASAHAAMECELVQAVPLGRTRNGTPSSTLVIAEVRRFHVREGLLSRGDRGQLLSMDAGALEAVGRLGGMAYTETSARFVLDRPARPEETA